MACKQIHLFIHVRVNKIAPRIPLRMLIASIGGILGPISYARCIVYRVFKKQLNPFEFKLGIGSNLAALTASN